MNENTVHSPVDLATLYARLKPTSDHSVTLYDRPSTDLAAVVVGTVNGGPHGVEVFLPHYSLAERASARIDGEFATIGDGVIALVLHSQER
jgi:hypothetical protein